MESRKIVLKNLFIGQQWRNRHREETYGHGERVGEDDTFFTTSNSILLCLCQSPRNLHFDNFPDLRKHHMHSTEKTGTYCRHSHMIRSTILMNFLHFQFSWQHQFLSLQTPINEIFSSYIDQIVSKKLSLILSLPNTCISLY